MRICSYNVHLWADARGRANCGRVIELLQELQCDVVALNEVPTRGGELARVAAALDMDHAFAPAGFLGNALLAKRPLRALRRFELGPSRGEGRSALVATLEGPDHPIDVCCTHLDPSEEDTRLTQLAALHGALSQHADAWHVVAGDFNALRLDDYDAPAHARIADMRARNEREEARGDVIAAMDARGYADAFVLARTLARPHPEPVTCWAGTRIDYLWLSAALCAHAALTDYRHVASDASDHVPVVAELDVRAP